MSTPILGLYRPLGTDVVDVTAHISDQMATIDTNIGAFVCSSTTRPVTPFAGQILFVTDLGTIEVWDEALAVWRIISFVDERKPRGLMAFDSSNADSELVNNGESTDVYMSVTFNAETGRKYRYSFVILIDPPDGSGISDEGGVDIRIKKAQGASVSKTDDNVYFERLHYADDGSELAVGYGIVSPDFTLSPAGQWTVGLFLAKFGANEMQINGGLHHNVLMVEDVGVV